MLLTQRTPRLLVISRIFVWQTSPGETHKALQSLSLLFAPTGSLQEVASSTGWGDAFLRLAARFDEAASGS